MLRVEWVVFVAKLERNKQFIKLTFPFISETFRVVADYFYESVMLLWNWLELNVEFSIIKTALYSEITLIREVSD